jgi:hypothetical protein
MSDVVIAPTVTLEDDTLSVTVERQVAQYGDHTTVRAHLSTKITPPGDESVDDYQARVEEAVAQLALPLKVAVLTELGRPFSIEDGVVHETVLVATSEGAEAGKVIEFPRAASGVGNLNVETTQAIPVKEWREQNGRNTLVTLSSYPDWVPTVAAEYEWAREVIHGQRKDGKGDYYQVSDGQRGGKRQFINKPKAGEFQLSADDDNKPF